MGFDWNDLSEYNKRYWVNYIRKNPYSCDNCGDTYNKDDLYKDKKEYKCKQCMEEQCVI